MVKIAKEKRYKKHSIITRLHKTEYIYGLMIFIIILTKRILIINATILILKYLLYIYILIVTLPYIYIQKRHTTKTVIVIKIIVPYAK
jgi:hypothetical protein